MVCCTAGPCASRSASGNWPAGQTSGCLSGRNSASTTMPCSKLSMPSAAASRNPTEHRCPVILSPRACAAVRAASISARDMHVRLERMRALVRPILDEFARIGGVAEFRHLGRETAVTLEIADRDEHLRSGHPALVDHLLEIEIGVRFERAGRPRRGDAGSEIEPRKTESVLDVNGNAGAGGIEQMLV